jgi:hypothetical protein
MLLVVSGCSAPTGSGARASTLSQSPGETRAQAAPTNTLSAKLAQASQPTGQATVEGEESGPDPATRTLEKGEQVALTDGTATLGAASFAENTVRYFNTRLPDGKTVYFFVARDQYGTYHTAANACQVCFASKLGFRHEGDLVICNTCGNRYPLAKVATQKGGCNPAPINPSLEVKDGKLAITQAQFEQVSGLF